MCRVAVPLAPDSVVLAATDETHNFTPETDEGQNMLAREGSAQRGQDQFH